jgi:ribonuclease H / adenosylcobalamin/alpha-ribazole phosphatase
MAAPQFIVHSDGGARGNPGPAACGFVVTSETGTLLHEASRYLGETTNNMAEYQGVVEALAWLESSTAKDLGVIPGASISFYLDSTLVVNQILGKFKVKEPRFLPLLARIHQLITSSNFSTSFHAIPRAQNRHADRLVNQALDRAGH